MASASLLRSSVLRSSPIRLSGPARPRFSSSSSSPNQKAQQAQDTAARLWAQLQTLLAPVGQRAGQMLGSYRQPLLYNLAVAREVLKHIYVAEGLRPPTLAAVRAAYETMWTRGSSPAYWRGALGNGEAARVGVYAVEAYGIFKIGEIIGRRSLIGYDLE